MTDFPIKLEPEIRKELIVRFQNYLRDEFALESGDLAAGFLVEFAGKIVGPVYYNAGLRDALTLANQHNESLSVDVLALEQDLDPRAPEGDR
jgi:uncharacterized protein (DUF2164 family)